MQNFLKKFSKTPKKPATPSNMGSEGSRSQSTDSIITGTKHGGDSQVANKDNRSGNHPALNASSLTCIGGWSVEQRSELAPGGTSGVGQHDRDAYNVEQSRVKKRGQLRQALDRFAAVVNIVKGPAEAFGPLKAVLESIAVVYAGFQKTVAVENKIEILHSRIATLEELFENPASDEEEIKRREELLIKLKGVGERVQSLDGKSAPLRYLDNAQDSDDVSGLLEDLQEAVNDYMMKQQMAIHEQACQLLDAAQMDVLNSFNSRSCARKAEFRHGERKGCLKGTRTAVLDAIELWAMDFSKAPIYWLNGLAGTGKSTIAKTIAERLFAASRLGASFFCSRDFEDRRNLHSIFPTLATQLAHKYPEFRSILVPLIQSDPNVADESLYNQMQKLIVRPLCETSISTVIIIDALDECEDQESASAILSILGRLVPKIPKVKFFLTGRPESRISRGFRPLLLARMADKFVLHKVESDEITSDIRLFFKISFSEIAGYWELENWPTEENLDRLCDLAAGLFVYAAATINFLSSDKWDPTERLDNLLQSKQIGGHDGKTLDKLYTTILHGAFANGEPGEHAKLRSILSTIVLATNPLSPSAIATLLGVNAKSVSPLLLSVNSLLLFQEDINHPVRPFHKSFPDFITNSTRCTDQRFHISPPVYHSELLICCLELMDRKLEKNMCKLPAAVANSDVSNLKQRIDKYIDPALQYACVAWHMHLVGALTTSADAPKIITNLSRFLQRNFLFWLEVVSVLGAARNAAEAMQVTTGWMKACQIPTSLGPVTLAEDCFRFVSGYFEIIRTSALHIYHSALVLAPKNSLVRKVYESHAEPLVRVVHGLSMSWDSCTATTTCPSANCHAVWSPCNRFIAIARAHTESVDVLDSATLQRLQTLDSPHDTLTNFKILIFSPDSRILTCSSRSLQGRVQVVVSWDLQTGAIVSDIKRQQRELEGRPSITYSTNGKMVAVFHWYGPNCAEITICNVASGVSMHSHSTNCVIRLSNNIWTHEESLRFATVNHATTTIWEVEFTSGATPTEVETLPVPVDLTTFSTEARFHPASCRLAVIDTDFVSMSFSSNGRFFACSTYGSEIYVWKEYPTGYILHEILASSNIHSNLLFSGHGESMIAFADRTIQLWHTNDFTTPYLGTLNQVSQHSERFVLSFSPDGTLAVFAMENDDMITVLDLKAGAPRLITNVGENVRALGVAENTIVVFGRECTTWNLTAENCVSDAKMDVKDRTSIDLKLGDFIYGVYSASISPDSRRIALIGNQDLHIYSTFNGERLGLTKSSALGLIPFFSADGCEVWCVGVDGEAEVWRVGGRQRMLELIKDRVHINNPPEGCPLVSSRGYQVTKDWWLLGPDGKRLLMLPPLWQSDAVQRVWKEQFLALLHRELSEPVILELEVKP